MGINYFSEFKDPAKIARTGLRGSFVRISNSAQNRWKTYSIGKDMATASRALTLVGQVGSTFGGAVGAAALMSPVVAASAFAATVGGPQIAVTAGVLGLASLAYDSYSNRDQRHTELAKYAWSLIDDVRPQFDILSDPMHLAAAASHAMYLMKEGENQYKIMGSKLEAAQKNFNAFWENYQSKRISPLILSGAIKNEWRMEAFMRQTEQEEQQYGKSLQHMDSLERRYEQLSSEHADLGKIYNDGLSEWNNACAAGKPVFEFMRRLVHTGNYIQCPYIIHLATLDKLATGYPRPQTSSTASTFDDILSSWDGAQHYRKVLAEISDAKKAAETNFKELNNFLASPARKMVFPHITIMS